MIEMVCIAGTWAMADETNSLVVQRRWRKCGHVRSSQNTKQDLRPPSGRYHPWCRISEQCRKCSNAAQTRSRSPGGSGHAGKLTNNRRYEISPKGLARRARSRNTLEYLLTGR